MTEQEFERQIHEALGEIDAKLDATPRHDVFSDVLVRFARTLSQHRAIGAAVEKIPEIPGGQRLLMWPKLRRDERSTMLNFARYGSELIVLGAVRRQFTTPGELEEYLAQNFLRGSSFPETLALWEERCSSPVRGFLRRGGPNEVSPGDVLVHVDPEEQRKLAEARPGSDLTLLLREDRLPTTSLYESEGTTYHCLIAGGYGLWVMFHSRAEDGRLRVAGASMTEAELA